MSVNQTISSSLARGVALVDGTADVRHARQLLLRSEGYDVKSYPTSAALLADTASRDDRCIILDVNMDGIDGFELLRQMRATGWHGTALLLDDLDPGRALRQEPDRQGDMILDRQVGDHSLLTALASSIDHDRAGRIPRR
jgi:CheY-like chemotaxis protein